MGGGSGGAYRRLTLGGLFTVAKDKKQKIARKETPKGRGGFWRQGDNRMREVKRESKPEGSARW